MVWAQGVGWEGVVSARSFFGRWAGIGLGGARGVRAGGRRWVGGACKAPPRGSEEGEEEERRGGGNGAS